LKISLCQSHKWLWLFQCDISPNVKFSVANKSPHWSTKPSNSGTLFQDRFVGEKWLSELQRPASCGGSELFGSGLSATNPPPEILPENLSPGRELTAHNSFGNGELSARCIEHARPMHQQGKACMLHLPGTNFREARLDPKESDRGNRCSKTTLLVNSFTEERGTCGTVG
jgi:hypothetical protein